LFFKKPFRKRSEALIAGLALVIVILSSIRSTYTYYNELSICNLKSPCTFLSLANDIIVHSNGKQETVYRFYGLCVNKLYKSLLITLSDCSYRTEYSLFANIVSILFIAYIFYIGIKGWRFLLNSRNNV